MTESISRKELCGYLSLLRRQLAGQSLFPAPNVIFLNSRALYHHLARQTCGGITVGEILQKIEHTCIKKMRKIAIVNLRHNIKINDKTGEMKSPVFMLKLVNICKKLLTKNMRIFDTNFERLHL